jgi:hypothetical protein
MGLNEISCQIVDEIHLTQDMDRMGEVIVGWRKLQQEELRHIVQGVEIEEDENDGLCGTYGGNEKFI